jgi:hypothetical protein
LPYHHAIPSALGEEQVDREFEEFKELQEYRSAEILNRS